MTAFVVFIKIGIFFYYKVTYDRENNTDESKQRTDKMPPK
jgi:hypothetical protein